MQRPDVRAGLDRAAFDYQSSTPQELGAFLKEQLKVWGTVTREAGLAAHRMRPLDEVRSSACYGRRALQTAREVSTQHLAATRMMRPRLPGMR